ncbi:MAG: hypothetical protein ACTSVG_13115 [Alphaproteobacteria bacterium]
MTKLIRFLGDDGGAITIDWVALTAGILLLGIMVIYAIFNNGVANTVLNINSALASIDPGVNVGKQLDCAALSNC